jgi:hypothetical protein
MEEHNGTPIDNIDIKPDIPQSHKDLDSIRKSLLSRVVDEIDHLPVEDENGQDVIRPMPTTVPSKVRHTDSKDLPTKKVLTDKIFDLCDKMGKERPRCKKWTKLQLNEFLGKLINGGMDDINKAKDEHDAQSLMAESNPVEYSQLEEDKPKVLNVDQGALALYQMNIMLGSLVEGITNKEVKPRCGFYLDNFTGELESNKDTLLDAYKEIWSEYGEHLGPYLSATNRVMLINMSCGYNTLKREFECEKKVN